MSLTGICIIPPGPGNSSLSAKLITHISRRYPEQEHGLFHAEHRLFTDTSSQLPGADTKQRAYTHILTFSHNSRLAFVRATKAGKANEGSSITIPLASFDSFTALLADKMKPLWYPRQMLSIENGICVFVKNDTWRLCIGDARVSARSQGAGQLRGTVIELCDTSGEIEGIDMQSEGDRLYARELFRGVLQRIFKDTGETFSNVDFTIDETNTTTGAPDGDRHAGSDWNLANLYMDVMKGQR